MKTTEATKALQTLSTCLQADQAEAIRAFADQLGTSKRASLAAYTSLLAQARSTLVVPRRSPSQFREALECFSGLVSLLASKSKADVVRMLVQLFEQDVDCSLSTFIQDLDALRANRPTKKAKQKPKTADPRAAERLADALHQHVLQEAQFNRLLSELRDTKAVNTPTLHAVAQKFLGTDLKFKGRKSVVDAIIRRQQDEMRYAFQEERLRPLRR